MRLTEEHERIIAHALGIAAETYDKSAEAVRDTTPRIAEQLNRQAIEARELAEQIETEGLTD